MCMQTYDVCQNSQTNDQVNTSCESSGPGDGLSLTQNPKALDVKL